MNIPTKQEEKKIVSEFASGKPIMAVVEKSGRNYLTVRRILERHGCVKSGQNILRYRTVVQVGDKYGKLTVIKILPFQKGQPGKVECRCDCGNIVQIQPKKIVSLLTKSCGCWKNRRGGKSQTPEGYIWSSMIARCYNKKCKGYRLYGARGIRVCERWRSLQNFLEDIGQRPDPKMSLERIDNDGDYEPGNVIWASRKQQANNTSRNRFLEHNGERLTVQQWAEKIGIPASRLWARLNLGWSVADALTPGTLYGGRRSSRGKTGNKTDATHRHKEAKRCVQSILPP